MLHPDAAACYPVCKACGVAGICVRPVPVPAVPVKPKRPWQPNDERLAPAKCGCMLIPWAVFSLIGGRNPKVICDLHGETTIIKETIKKAKPGNPYNPGDPIPF